MITSKGSLTFFINAPDVSITEYAIKIPVSLTLLCLFYFTLQNQVCPKNCDSDVVEKQNNPSISKIFKNIVNFGFTVTVIQTTDQY